MADNEGQNDLIGRRPAAAKAPRRKDGGRAKRHSCQELLMSTAQAPGGGLKLGGLGVDLMAYSRDASRFVGVQGKAFTKRTAVPLGGSLEKIMGDFWIIMNRVAASPSALILLPGEVAHLARHNTEDGKVSYWLEPPAYENTNFKEAGERIGRGA